MESFKSFFTSKTEPNKAELEHKFMATEINESEFYRSDHSFYGYRSGFIKDPNRCAQ
jgi:hypothetical protein